MTATRARTEPAHRPGLRHGTSLVLLVALAAAAAAAESPTTPVAVRVATVALRPVRELRELVGTVRARTSATVAAQLMGTITEVAVRAGDTVQRGQLLAEIEDRAVAAEHERAAAERRRFETLLAKGAVTRAEYDEVLARARVAKAALDHTRVVAPLDGIVAQRLVDPGDMAAPGKPLLVVEPDRGWRLEAEVPERLGASVAVGDAVTVRVDATDEGCPGTVVEVIPAANPATRSFTAKIDLACTRPLRSGTFGRAFLPLGERDAVVVPAGAVHRRGQLRYVFVERDGHARMRLVRTGRTHDAGIEVLAGLEPGDRLVIAADGALVDGRPVTVGE